MFAYVDETGNTGGNVFDENQPYFNTAALITKTDFDILNRGAFRRILLLSGHESIHANKIGMEKLEIIAPEILRLLKKSDARIFISRLEKRYLAVTRIVDTVFDSYENRAVPWHVYNFKHLKLILLLKLAQYVIDDYVAKIFWDGLISKNKKNRAKYLFPHAQLCYRGSTGYPMSVLAIFAPKLSIFASSTRTI